MQVFHNPPPQIHLVLKASVVKLQHHVCLKLKLCAYERKHEDTSMNRDNAANILPSAVLHTSLFILRQEAPTDILGHMR
jgi:hypothetical protein